jgi:hypothetical protein
MDVLEVPVAEHLHPRFGANGMLPPSDGKPAGIAGDSYEAGRTATGNRPQFLHQDLSVTRLEGQGAHHVADDEPPSGDERAAHLAQREFLVRIVEVMERVVGDGEGDAAVVERQ